jgi:hypothetical protein
LAYLVHIWSIPIVYTRFFCVFSQKIGDETKNQENRKYSQKTKEKKRGAWGARGEK